MISEISVSIRDEEKTLRKKFLSYETYTANIEDEYIKACIAETIKYFSCEPKGDLRVVVKICLKAD